MKQRTEEEFYNESRRLRAETMLMADTLRDNPLRFTITNGITMDVEELPTSRLLEATGQQAYYRHVGGIVIVEELAEPLLPSSLAVVHRQQRHSQPAGQVDHAVGGAVEDEKGDGIE